jgi:hypothetical protein
VSLLVSMSFHQHRSAYFPRPDPILDHFSPKTQVDPARLFEIALDAMPLTEDDSESLAIFDMFAQILEHAAPAAPLDASASTNANFGSHASISASATFSAVARAASCGLLRADLLGEDDERLPRLLELVAVTHAATPAFCSAPLVRRVCAAVNRLIDSRTLAAALATLDDEARVLFAANS